MHKPAAGLYWLLAKEGNVIKKTILVVIILLLLGAAGVSAWHWHNNSKSSNSSSSNTNSNSSQTTNSNSSNGGGSYLVIKEWGVRFKLSDETKDATYKYDSNLTVFLGSKKLEQLSGCANPQTLPLERAKNNDDAIGPTTLGDILKNNPSALTKVGDYYYKLIIGGLSCVNSNNPTDLNTYRQITDGFIHDVSSLEAVKVGT